MVKKLLNYHIILNSGSTRRQQFLKDLGINYELRIHPVEEIYPIYLSPQEIAEYLAILKANAFNHLNKDELLITGDTVVCLPIETLHKHSTKILGKPKNEQEAKDMLQMLSGTTHEVISSICLRTSEKTRVRNATTKVWFKKLTQEEIDYYVKNYSPYDKAGAYGIQDWIGKIGVTKIEGSYENVMGMPTHLLYELLTEEF